MNYDPLKLGMRSQWPIIEQEVENYNRWLNVYFGDDGCNDFTIIWILSHMPLISIENIYCCCDLDKGQTDLVDVCEEALQKIHVYL